MYPHFFKEDFGSVLCYDKLLTGRQYIHIRKSIHNGKYTIITMIGRREVRHIIHGDGFPRLIRGRQRGIEALLLDGRFGNGAGSA